MKDTDPQCYKIYDSVYKEILEKVKNIGKEEMSASDWEWENVLIIKGTILRKFKVSGTVLYDNMIIDI